MDYDLALIMLIVLVFLVTLVFLNKNSLCAENGTCSAYQEYFGSTMNAVLVFIFVIVIGVLWCAMKYNRYGSLW